MRVRAMTLDDAAAVAELSGQLGYPSTAEMVRRRFGLLQEGPACGLFVAESGAAGVVGWVHVTGTCLLESDPVAEIGGLVVDAGRRRQGAGRALVAAAEDWARRHGYLTLSVRTNVKRVEAPRFYERLGFALVKSQFRFAKRLGSGGGSGPGRPQDRPRPVGI
jgi:GNAT superfamily N-acetyltransferase